MVAPRRALARFTAVLAAATLATTGFAIPAHAADSGLFGDQDPTYDGVFRQGLAITALHATGVDIPERAVDWLLDQQCANGSFEAYRADSSAPCGKSDPKAFSGPDTNSTALAATALYLAGEQAAARRAVTWLIDAQNRDWGFPYYSGGSSDANSTGLSLIALQTVQPQDRSARVPNAKGFLGTLKLKCSSGGGLAYMKGSATNGLASAQGYAGLAGGLPTAPQNSLAGNPRCTKGKTDTNVGAFLAKAMTAGGAVPSDFGPGPDYTATGWAILGFVGEGVGSRAVSSGVRALKTNVRDYGFADGDPNPGALALMSLVAEATGENPRSFGGVNLITGITGSMQ